MKYLSFVIAWLFMLPVFAQTTPDLAGTWTMTVETPMGTKTQEVVVRQEGSQWMAKNEHDEFEIVLDNQNVSWETFRKTFMGKMELTFNGQIHADGSLSGKAKGKSGMMKNKEMPWTMKRQG